MASNLIPGVPVTATSTPQGIGASAALSRRHRTSSGGTVSCSTGSSLGTRRAAFTKIRLCKFYQQGLCWHGEQCAYAHGKSELRDAPDLRKTKLCQQHRLGRCAKGENCIYAHSRAELRCTPDLYKTSLCRFWLRGKCGAAENCRHAHGEAELRVSTTEAALTPPTSDTMSFALERESSSSSHNSLQYRDIDVNDDEDVEVDKLLTERLYDLLDELAAYPELRSMSTTCYYGYLQQQNQC
ncbi:hypothetical protein FOL47_000002 [Perkinsus chesapeaki]|uniref:C3H1-type domain-containing protein n=1 Tax=Perkinsus chesapeaki TaxID=330153 RepID=A0A7J6N344_PERCH|nr:hypothetical protein FOL47_000002 [Perkinsus chesapeaki]